MISREVYVFLAMIICGGALAVVFDMLRAMRMVLNPSAVIVSASDILFWIFAAFVISAAAWNFNSGIFRFYETLGIILGAVFYFLLFSKWILKLFLFIFEMKNIKDKRICQSKVGEQAGFSDVAYLYG